MINQYGQWYPDYPGQQLAQDPAYLRFQAQQAAQMQQMQQLQQQALQTQQTTIGAQNQQPIRPMQQPAQQQPQSAQSGGFVSVRSRQEAKDWNVLPGQSITFIDENAPYCYTKSMGYSQLERPQFAAYRLVKEEETQPIQQAPQATQQAAQAAQDAPRNADVKLPDYALKSDVDALTAAIDGIRDSLVTMRDKIEKINADLYSTTEPEKPEKREVKKK